MSQPEDMSTGFHRSTVPKVSVSREVMVGLAVAIFLAVVVILFVILYPYAKRVWAPSRALSRRRSRLVFAVTDPVSIPRCGLSSTVLKALPVTVFHVSEEELVCAVCLRQLNDGEQVRILPKCNHGFHLECIDMWFQSHSTCPLCRNPVEINLTPNSSTEKIPATVAVSVGDFVSNMYTGADRIVSAAEKPASSSVSTSVKREGMLVIDIPRLRMEEFLLSSTSLPTSETSKTPTSVRRRTLTRFLSVGNSTTGFFSASPGEIRGDIEQGKRGDAEENRRVSTPRIPRNS